MTQQRERDWERWLELTDREAVDELLDEADAAFLRDHESEDDRCRDDRALWSAVEEFAQRGSVPAADDEATVRAVLEQMGHTTEQPRSRRAWWAVGGALLAAAVALLWVLPRSPEPTQAIEVQEGSPTSEMIVHSGRVFVGGIQLDAGEALPEGTVEAASEPACIAGPGYGTACLEPSSRVSVRRADGGRTQLQLRRGEVEVDLDRAGVVTTAGDAVRVEGSSFRVGFAEMEAMVVVTAVAGSVHVVGPDGAHEAAAGDVIEIALSREKRSNGSRSSATPKRTTDPQTLLERAQSVRGDGDAREAAALYRKLLARHPKSAEAQVAWLSLGELELDSLGNPAGALRAYDNYLRRGGPLAREARFQRIRALRKLGRLQAETEAIADFLRRHPNSVYGPALRKRQQELTP